MVCFVCSMVRSLTSARMSAAEEVAVMSNNDEALVFLASFFTKNFTSLSSMISALVAGLVEEARG